MNFNEKLSDPEFRRFAHQISSPQVGIIGQEKLKNVKIAVIGAGGLGSVILQYLSAIGVGYLGIIDYALVEESNIQRQVLYGGNDLGKLKAIISKQNLQNIFPFVNFEIFNIQLNSNNIEKIIGSFDLIVDATNDEFAHTMICNACETLNLPWVCGSINEFEGQVAVFDSRKGGGSSQLQFVERSFSCANDNKSGGTILSYGFVGNLMAFEVFKFVIGSEESLMNKLLTVNLLSYQIAVKSLI